MGLDTRGRVSSPMWRPRARPTCAWCHPACVLTMPSVGHQRASAMVVLAWSRSSSHYHPGSAPHLVPGGVSHNGEGGGGGGGGGTEGGGTGDGTEEEDLGAFWELLDNELRPIKPLPSCPESQSIFSEHKEMARKYLVLQQEIFNLRKRKAGLEEKLSQAEKLEQLGNQRYQDKIRELENKRENLRHNHSRLRRQLEQIRMRQAEQQQQEQQEDGSEGCPGHNLPLAPP